MNIAIILSGGVGSRMGGNIPKQYLEVCNRPIISWCIDKFACRNDIEAIVIVVADEWIDYVKTHISNKIGKLIFAQPGETRQFSIYNGLNAAKAAGFSDNDVVIIHDAARPLVKDKTINECIYGLEEGYDGVMPVLKVKDTIYLTDDGIIISSLLDRSKLRAGQAPESFRLGRYLALHENMSRDELLKINGSTELAFKAGEKVKIIEGDEGNFKITTPEDLLRFKQIIQG